MRLTRVTLFFLALIISFGFYRLIVYLLDDVDAQTFQATEEVMVDTAHVMAGMIESELTEEEKPDAEMLREAFSRAQAHTLEAKIHKPTSGPFSINQSRRNLAVRLAPASAGQEPPEHTFQTQSRVARSPHQV